MAAACLCAVPKVCAMEECRRGVLLLRAAQRTVPPSHGREGELAGRSENSKTKSCLFLSVPTQGGRRRRREEGGRKQG